MHSFILLNPTSLLHSTTHSVYIGVSKCTTQGQKLMMIGTADEIVKAPEKGPVFVEDLPEEEQAAALVCVASSFYAYIRCSF